MTKLNQDNERKVRENAILIKDLQADRDKYKELSVEKEEEIHELGVQIKVLRTSNTDLKLIEEKVDAFLQEITSEIEIHKRAARQQLQQFLRVVQGSDALSQIISIR